jgi:hypothetical protein
VFVVSLGDVDLDYPLSNLYEDCEIPAIRPYKHYFQYLVFHLYCMSVFVLTQVVQ